MKSKPYIGITGFKTAKEVEYASKVFREHLKGLGDYTAMFGFITSTKRLSDKTKSGERAPAINELSDLVKLVPENFFSALHHHNTKPDKLYDEICQLQLTIPNELGLQINSAWPLVSEIKKIKKHFPEKKIILQLSKQMIDYTTLLVNQPEIFKEYNGLVDYVLIDPSGGKGIEFDLDDSTITMIYHYNLLPGVIFGVAGGFSGTNVAEKITYLSKFYRGPFSIDSEKNLRSKNLEGSFLDPKKVEKYISNAAKAIKSNANL